MTMSTSSSTTTKITGNITILDSNEHYLVVSKPPSVLCHHSDWTGSSRKSRHSNSELPMLQRIRQAKNRPINLIHRLDRGASGCLLCCYADNHNSSLTTSTLINTLQQGQKTYLAIVRGEGIEEDLKQRGWFTVDRPIKDEKGNLNNATTEFLFVAGQHNERGALVDRPRASLVLARLSSTGRWHQIRRHLNGLSHPIIGDTTHGDNRINREWKQKYGLCKERLCLHLCKMELPADNDGVAPNGIHVTCPLPDDMMTLLETQIPNVLKEAEPILQQEGIFIRAQSDGTSHDEYPQVLPYEFEIQQNCN